MVFGKMEVIVLQPKYTKQKTIKLSFRERITSQFLLTANGVPQSFFFFLPDERLREYSTMIFISCSQHAEPTWR